MVRRQLVASRQAAVEAIEAGRVTVAGAPATKAARLVAPDEPVLVAHDGPRYVSRGGHKLAAALDRFDLDPAGWRCLDAGSSTGGFTDCLLQRGAAEVVAVDVGTGQLDPRLRHDERVDVHEQTNIRHLGPGDLGEDFRLVVADLSFISIGAVIDVLVSLATPAGDLVVLVKPQFESGRKEASRGKGVIRDPAVWQAALERADAAWTGVGAAMMGLMVSPVRGARGNVEFLAHLRPDAPGPSPSTLIADAVGAAIAEGDS